MCFGGIPGVTCTAWRTYRPLKCSVRWNEIMMKGNFLLCMQLRETEQYDMNIMFFWRLLVTIPIKKNPQNVPVVLTSYSRSYICKCAGFSWGGEKHCFPALCEILLPSVVWLAEFLEPSLRGIFCSPTTDPTRNVKLAGLPEETIALPSHVMTALRIKQSILLCSGILT